MRFPQLQCGSLRLNVNRLKKKKNLDPQCVNTATLVFMKKKTHNPQHNPRLTPWIRNPLKPPEDRTFTIPDEYQAPPGIPTVRPGWKTARKPSKYKRPQKFSPPPRPTDEQTDDFALTIDVENNITDKDIHRMLLWKPGVSLQGIPKWKLKRHFYEAQNRWTEALLLLVRCMEENHALMIRRIRRYGNRVRTRYWTKSPLKHGQTPPARRRGYIPPIVLERHAHAPPGASPPEEWRMILFLHPDADATAERCKERLLLFASGGGHRPSVLRLRPDGTPSPHASPRSLTIEEKYRETIMATGFRGGVNDSAVLAHKSVPAKSSL